jgi:hypothetical protein
MKQGSCPQEEMALKAVRTGTWEEDLSAHVTVCDVCRVTVQVSGWMQALKEGPEGTLTLPDAERLWLRAQLSEKHAEAERAQKILDWAEFIFSILVSAGVSGWIGWNWSAIQTRLSSFSANAWQQLWATVSYLAGATPILSTFGVVIFSLVAFVLAYPLLARD